MIGFFIEIEQRGYKYNFFLMGKIFKDTPVGAPSQFWDKQF